MILEARTILAIPDTSKRKSEYRIIDRSNKGNITNPNIIPKLFLECKIINECWDQISCVFDVESNKVYKNVSGCSKNGFNQYLKEVKRPFLKANKIHNYKSVLSKIMNSEK